MTIQELKALADQGDVKAMYALGNHYLEKYENDDLPRAVEEALPWYTLAGRHGFADGALMSMTCSYARILMVKEQGDIDSMSQYTRDAAVLGAEFMRNETLATSKAADEIMRCMDICLYTSSLSSYVTGHYEEAIQDLELDPSSEYYNLSQVLLGLCFCDLDMDIDGAKHLLILEHAMDSILPKAHDQLDEEIFEKGVVYLSLFYRVIENKPGKAYVLLNKALSFLEDDLLRARVIDEISRYKRNILGFYKYVG